MAKRKVKGKKVKGKRSKAKKVVRKIAKKAARKTRKPALKAKKGKAAKKTAVKKEKALGYITHYFDKISVAAIKLSAPLNVGDWINIKGHTTDFKQRIDSIQINHQNVLKAKKGDEIGIKVKDYVRDGDKVYAAKEETTAPMLSRQSIKPAVSQRPALPQKTYKPPEIARPTLFKPILPLKPNVSAKPQTSGSAPVKPEQPKTEPKKDYSQIKFLGF